jgi:hypothetical protein
MLKLRVAPNLFIGAPQWWDEVLQRTTQIQRRERVGWWHQSGLDHLRHFKNLFVCQPYGIEGEALTKLLELCRCEGLVLKIMGPSNHYPSCTFSLMIFRPQDQADYQEFVSRIRSSEIVVPGGKSLVEGGAL